MPGCLTWDRGTVTCESWENVEDVETDKDFPEVALVVAGAGKFLVEGVIDISEEAPKASGPSLLEKIVWWVVGKRATEEVIEDDRVSWGRPGKLLWTGSIEDLAGEVLDDNRDEWEVPSLKIRRRVAASELVGYLDPGPLSVTGR